MAFVDSDSDPSYDGDEERLQHSTASRMNLRNTSRLKRPVRYRDDVPPVSPGRPIFVHPDPVFNMDRASFVQWRTLSLDEPSPGEAQYKLWQEQGEPRDAFGKPVVPSSPSRGEVQVAASPGPTVAHLRRQSATVRPDLSQSVVDTIEQRDAFDEAFEENLADFRDDDEPQSNGDSAPLVLHPQLSSEYKDWSALSKNVQWAIIYDLVNDHQDGIAAAANLLGLTLPEVISFVNMYVREKALWENDAHQDEIAHPAGVFFQLDDERDEVVWAVPEGDVDQIMQDSEPDRQHIAVGATQMITDAGVDPQSLEGVGNIWNESETEPFFEKDNKDAAEKGVGQLGGAKPADQPGVQADEEQPLLSAWPPLVELVTDSFSREDIASGRSFLTFVGLQEYADRFSEWFGKGTSFREIPGIFDENNEFIFSTEDTKKALYSGNELDWQGPAPQPMKDPAQREWLMEALPQDPSRHRRSVSSPLQQAHALAERINGRPIKLYDKDGDFFDYVPEGTHGGLRYAEHVQPGALADILAAENTDEKEAQSLVRKGPEPGGRAGSNVARQTNKPYGTNENLTLEGTLGDFSDEGARLFNTSAVMQNCPYMPRFDNGLARRFLEVGRVDIDEGLSTRRSITPSHLLPQPQLPPFLQPHEGIVQAVGKAVPTGASLGHDSSQIAGNDQTSQAQARDTMSVTPSSMPSRSIKTSSNLDARGIAENVTQDTRVTVGPASGEEVSNTAQSDAQGAADSGRFSENGIEVETFPKCSSCFKVRARCIGGRPCNSCVTRNRKCNDVTKAELDHFPARAQRVLQDKAKADSKAAQAEGQNNIRATASNSTPAVPAVSKSMASGVKRNHTAITRGNSTDEDDSDLDHFPSEKEDPEDGDYDSTPKKKRPKKGNTPASKKQATSKQAPATPTPTKTQGPRGPRGPYRKKVGTPTPKRNEPVAGATSTPAPQPGGSPLTGRAVTATSAQNNPAKTPAAMKKKSSGFSRNAGEGGLSGAGAGRSVHGAAEAVRHAGGQSGTTNVRPVPVGKRGEGPKLAQTQSVLYPSLFSPETPDAEDAPYLNIAFAPVVPQSHPPMHRVPVGTPMTPVSRPFAGLANTALRASPSQGAYPIPGARSHLIPPRPQTASAEDDHLSGAGLPNTGPSLKSRMAVHEMIPVTAERLSLVPQIARPGLSGSPGATDISPTSQSSGSGSTVSMDFLRMPLSRGQGSPAYSHGSMSSGKLQQFSPNHRTMSGLSPDLSAGVVPVASPQRPLLVPSYNNGTHSSVTSVPPLMEATPGFAMAPGLMSPYAMFQQQRPIPRPVSRLQEGSGYPVPQPAVHPTRPSGMFRDVQSEAALSGPRGISASPSRQQHTPSPRPTKRQADASLNFGQQPARKKPRASNSPLAPPREARSWKELARTQWATEAQEDQSETANFSVKPVFGGDASYEVSFSQFTRIHEQIDPELQQTAIAEARKMNQSSAGTSEKR